MSFSSLRPSLQGEGEIVPTFGKSRDWIRAGIYRQPAKGIAAILSWGGEDTGEGGRFHKQFISQALRARARALAGWWPEIPVGGVLDGQDMFVGVGGVGGFHGGRLFGIALPGLGQKKFAGQGALLLRGGFQ